MTIAVTAATGQLGRLVIAKLKAKTPAKEIVALARNPAKAADLGVAVREADYSKPETLAKALAGVDTLLLISSSEIGQRAAQHRNVIEAAKKAGVKRIVYTSLLRADSTPLSLGAEHKATEADLRASGVPFTILRNGWYTENYTGSVGGALAGGAFIGASGEGKISAAARADYADAAVAALTSEGHAGRTYELAGDEAFTLKDLAAEISRQSGKTIPYKNLPESDYAAALSGHGLPPGIAKAIAGWGVDASKGALFDDSHALSKLIGRPTTPLSASVGDALR
jgi:NAD(P)H dehydrogenase (quinone)